MALQPGSAPLPQVHALLHPVMISVVSDPAMQHTQWTSCLVKHLCVMLALKLLPGILSLSSQHMTKGPTSMKCVGNGCENHGLKERMTEMWGLGIRQLKTSALCWWTYATEKESSLKHFITRDGLSSVLVLQFLQNVAFRINSYFTNVSKMIRNLHGYIIEHHWFII